MAFLTLPVPLLQAASSASQGRGGHDFGEGFYKESGFLKDTTPHEYIPSGVCVASKKDTKIVTWFLWVCFANVSIALC